MNGEVRHIGCSERGIAKRLHHYETTKTKTRKPAFKVRGLITKELKAGSKVEVFTIVPAVDLVTKLRYKLIREFQPSWNERGVITVQN